MAHFEVYALLRVSPRHTDVMTRGKPAFALGHRPALDGLRAIAVLLVILTHAGVPYLGQAGAVGVTMFFVLSGFLITRLLLEEQQRSGRINFRRFYVRRVRRLLPALLTLLFLDGLVRAASGQSLIPVALAASYMSNIAPSAFGVMFRELEHTWSLSLEEQFYLLWPVLLVLLVRTRYAMLALVTGVIASAAIRVGLWAGGADAARIYIAPDTRADALIVGCLLGFTIHTIHRPGRITATAAAVTLAAFCTFGYVGILWALLPAAACAAVLIAWSLDHRGWLASRPLVFVGRISYGLYLWHYPVALVVRHHLGVAGLPVTVAISVVLAVMSWYCVELPFMRHATGADGKGTDEAQNSIADPPPIGQIVRTLP